MINELATILQSNIFTGFLLLLVIIPLYVKLGIFDKLWGRNEKNGIEKQLENIEGNHLHTISESLKRIEERLNDIHDGIIFIRAKINGK